MILIHRTIGLDRAQETIHFCKNGRSRGCHYLQRKSRLKLSVTMGTIHNFWLLRMERWLAKHQPKWSVSIPIIVLPSISTLGYSGQTQDMRSNGLRMSSMSLRKLVVQQFCSHMCQIFINVSETLEWDGMPSWTAINTSSDGQWQLIIIYNPGTSRGQCSPNNQSWWTT